MNAPALPAYLQNRQTPRLAEDAAAGMGSSLPAHISTSGGVFTLIDAAGNEQRLTFKGQDGRDYQQPHLDACVIDGNPRMSKRYYDKGDKYRADDTKPPLCWSANGIVPSKESMKVQARTCDECPHNVRGSAVSEYSGAQIKACRDEKWLALSVPQTGLDTIFRYVITPGSFKNWKSYTEAFKNGPVDISDVITRFEWVGPDEPNVLKFSGVSYIDEHTAQLREQAHAAKATDAIVGRSDMPAALPAPAAQARIEAQPASQLGLPGSFAAAPVAPSTAAPMQPASATPAAAGPEQAPAPGRRRRNTTQAAPAAPGQPLQAPFPTNQPGPAFPGSNGAATAAPVTGGNASSSFGIQPAVAPDPAISATIANLFPGQR